MHIEKSCGAVVFRGEKVLLLRHAKSKSKSWNVPKGHMEKNETERETARREIFEETGLTNLRFLPNFRKVSNYSFYAQNNRVQKQAVFFLAEALYGEVKISVEHSEYEWLTWEEAISRVRFKALKSILASAARYVMSGFSAKEN